MEPASEDCRAANDDTTSTLSKLRRQIQKPLAHAILDMFRIHQARNWKSQQFWEDLKCFLPIASASNEKREETEKVATHMPNQIQLGIVSPTNHYVAMSYPWEPSSGECDAKERYLLPPSMGNVKVVRDAVLDRAFRFIRYMQNDKTMIPLWIDKMSIKQRKSPEKETAMQSMDLVYKRCRYAIGYLWVQIHSSKEIYQLLGLLSHRFIDPKSKGSYPAIRERFTARYLSEIVDLLFRITNDRWWDRAWIFQEDYLAGTKMWLLLRHTEGLERPLRSKHIGNLSGEIVIRSDKFRESVTLFCLAFARCGMSNHNMKKKCSRILRKAGRYKILYESSYFEGKECPQRTLTTSILEELKFRNMGSRSDLLPITANVCGYDLRIETASCYSLSIALLTLLICNGEMLTVGGGLRDLDKDVFDYLANQSMRVEAPSSYKPLTLIKHSRLSVSGISVNGVHTNGILWRLGDTIRPSFLSPHRSSIYVPHGSRQSHHHDLRAHRKERLRDLCRVLDYRKSHGRHAKLYHDFVLRLSEFVNMPKRPKQRDEWSARRSMNIMAACVVHAMDNGLYLRLARPVEPCPDQSWGTPYSGIFIQSKTELEQSGPTYAFTSSFGTRERSTAGRTEKTLAKYASIKVSVHTDVDGNLPELTGHKWMNGLCFFYGRKKSPYVFRWPESLSS